MPANPHFKQIRRIKYYFGLFIIMSDAGDPAFSTNNNKISSFFVAVHAFNRYSIFLLVFPYIAIKKFIVVRDREHEELPILCIIFRMVQVCIVVTRTASSYLT